MYRVIYQKDPITKEKTWGVEGIDTRDGRQVYPYNTKEEAKNYAKFLSIKDRYNSTNDIPKGTLGKLDELQDR